MIDLVEALYSFWAGFGIEAYPESRIPDDARLPYLVYPVQIGQTMESMTSYVNIYAPNTADGMRFLTTKAAEICADIGGCKIIKTDSGNIIIREPSVVIRSDTNVSLMAYLSFMIDYNLRR